MKTNNCKEEEIAIPDGLAARLEQLIDGLAEQETQMKRRRMWLGTLSAAAAIALLFSTGIFFHTKQSNLRSIENPELAYFEAQKALEKVSVNFVKGMNQMTFVAEKMEKTNQILNKTFKKESK